MHSERTGIGAPTPDYRPDYRPPATYTRRAWGRYNGPIMRRINVLLPEASAERLRALARREMRDPRSQASLLIQDGLRRAGLDLSPRYDEDAEPSIAKPDHARPASDTAVGTDAADGVG